MENVTTGEESNSKTVTCQGDQVSIISMAQKIALKLYRYFKFRKYHFGIAMIFIFSPIPCPKSSPEEALSFQVYPSESLQELTLKCKKNMVV